MKLIIFQMLCIVLVNPLVLLAQEVETVISADQIIVQSDNILKAKGNVVVSELTF